MRNREREKRRKRGREQLKEIKRKKANRER